MIGANEIVIAAAYAMNRTRTGPITRADLADVVEHVAAFRGEPFDRAGFDEILDRMNDADEIELYGHPERAAVGRKPRWAHMLRAGVAIDAQLGTETRKQWAWCVAGQPCTGCGNPLCGGRTSTR